MCRVRSDFPEVKEKVTQNFEAPPVEELYDKTMLWCFTACSTFPFFDAQHI